MMIQKMLLVTLFALSSSMAMAADATISADKQAIDSACTSDAATAGCGTEQVGTGLMKCLHTYKKAHKDFKISDACKASMKQMHADKKAGK